jgi:hypothetical protein
VTRALALGLALCFAASVAAAEAEAERDAPKKKSSPYVEANKRHIDAKTGKHPPTTKRPALSGRAHSSPVKRKR